MSSVLSLVQPPSPSQHLHHHHHPQHLPNDKARRRSSGGSVSSFVAAAAAAAAAGSTGSTGPLVAGPSKGGAMSSLFNKVGVKALRHGASVQDGSKASGSKEHSSHPNSSSPPSSNANARLQNSSSVETLGPGLDARRGSDQQRGSNSSPLQNPAPQMLPPPGPAHFALPPPPRLGPDGAPVPQTLPVPGPSAVSADSTEPSPVSSTFSSITQSTNATSSMAHQLQSASAGVPTPPNTSPQPARLPDVGTRSYTILREIGDGSFGTVWLADWHSPFTLPPGVPPPPPSTRAEYKGKRLVAVKKMKKVFQGGWDECMDLKELRSLRTIPMNPHIIPLFDAFLHPTSRELHFVFEWMEGNLYQLTKTRKGRALAGGLVASIFRQTLLGTHHIHTCGFFHRDMKPENLLITTTGVIDYPHGSPFALPTAPPEKDVEVIVKIADFGLAREITSRPPYTEYVSTRWYRAPEVLLRSRAYNAPVDMWALGAIMAETVTLRPLFPGSSEMDQVNKICDVLGDPKTPYGVDDKGRLRGGGQWVGGVALADSVGFRFPDKRPIDFMRLFDLTNVPIQLVDIIHEMLLYDPVARLTTYQALAHAYFRDVEPRLRAYKYWPPAPHATFPQGPITPTSSSDGGMSRNALAPPGANPLSPPQSARMELDGAVSPRSMPSSHAHGLLAQVKPSFGGPRPDDGDSVMAESDSGYSLPIAPTGASYNQQHLGVPMGSSTPASAYSMPMAVSGASDTTASPNPSFRTPVPGITDVFASPNPSLAPTSKTRGRGLTSLFHSSTGPAAPSLKRTPSERSAYETPASPAVVASPALGGANDSLDPKKAKKEAEKLAKEQAKAKREKLRVEAQQRARAVMMKQQRMVQVGATELAMSAEFAGPNRKPISDGESKGKGRASGPGSATPALPQIAEDSSHLRPADVASRFRQRPRGDDDADVHSVSSHGSGRSNTTGVEPFDDGKRYSMGTIDSDPGPYRSAHQARSGYSHLARSPSRSSLGSASASRLSVASSPNLAGSYRLPTAASTTSSLDSQLISHMAGLSAGPGSSPAAPSGQQGPPPGGRLRSPTEPRFNPYPRPTLPGIEAFDFPPGTYPAGNGGVHDRHFTVASSGASILSSQSVPISISQQSHQQHHGSGHQYRAHPSSYQQQPPSTSPSTQQRSLPNSPLADPTYATASGNEDAMQEDA